MPQITIEVEDKHYTKVLSILTNLKPELIYAVNINNSSKPVTSSQNKYLSKDKYKNKVVEKQPILEDDFLSGKNQSRGKYLNKNAYKSKLKGSK